VDIGQEHTVKFLDNVHFAKCVRECGLLSKRDMQFGNMDIIFTRAKPVGGRKLEYKHFLEVRGVALAAPQRRPGTQRDQSTLRALPLRTPPEKFRHSEPFRA